MKKKSILYLCLVILSTVVAVVGTMLSVAYIKGLIQVNGNDVELTIVSIGSVALAIVGLVGALVFLIKMLEAKEKEGKAKKWKSQNSKR